jgi:Ca-activated chloride channel family protein
VKLYQVYGSRRLSEAEAARVRSIEVSADKQAEKRDGIKKDRQDDTQGGMRFFIPAFARDDSHALLFKLGLPAGVGARDVALIELKYKDRITKKNAIEEIPLKVAYANSDAESAGSADPSVARTVQGFAAGEALAEAARQIAIGDRGRAVALLSEREGILRTAAGTLNEPLFLKDADRLARLRGHAGSTSGLGDPLVLALLLETAAGTHLH